MTEEKKDCPCECTDSGRKKVDETASAGAGEMTLADLSVGSTATIVKIMPKMRGRKKFADVGLVAGSELLIESHAPLGGLIRVKVMETSMAFHKDDAANIVIKAEKSRKK